MRYIAAYDTERPSECLAACRRIREVHEQFGIHGTFFIVGKRLEEEGSEYRSVLGDVDLFEIASHSYSHRMLRDHIFCGPAATREEILNEIRLGKERVEQVFQRPCAGLRPGCGFPNGLRGDPWVVNAVAEAGYEYISSLAWGPDTTMPALFREPFPYDEEGHPDLWELPGHGWHENLLKSHNLTDRPQRILAWPSPFPEGVPLTPISTPEEEFEINRLYIDRALELGLPYVSLIWHPWSLARFDPEMKMLALTFSYIRERQIESSTYAAERERMVEVEQPPTT